MQASLMDNNLPGNQNSNSDGMHNKKFKYFSIFCGILMIFSGGAGYYELTNNFVVSNLILSTYALFFGIIYFLIEIKSQKLIEHISMFKSYEGRGIFHLLTGLSIVGTSIFGAVVGTIIILHGILNIVLYHTRHETFFEV